MQRGRLFRKYFLLILGLVCGALLISGGIGLYFSYQENKVALASLQREKAIAAAARIEQFVRQIEQQLAFAALPQLGVEGLEQRRIEFLKLLRLVPAVTDIAQIDPRGREQLAVSRLAMDVAGADKDRSQEPAFKNARPGQTWFGPVYFRKETEPYMSIAVRSGGESGPVTVAEVNLKFIWDVVTRIKIGQKGKAYVVDGSGYLVADPDIGLVLRKTDLSALEQVRAALKEGGDSDFAMLAKDFTGKAVLTAHASIDPLGWKVFVEQPVSEVMQALDATILRTVALIVAGLLFSALAAMWLARSMARPISVLQEGAQRIGAGDLDSQISVKTGDELETLADQFNRMTAQLRESYAGLERKVEERTAQLKETLEQQTAISEILRVISGSPGNVQPVLQAVAERAARICEAQYADIIIAEGDKMRVGAAVGDLGRPIGEFVQLDRTTVMGRSIVDKLPVHVADLQNAGDEFPLGQKLAHKYGHRTILAVPLVRENRAVGTILLRRTDVRPFEDKYIGLLKTFADQAAIAIENVRLFNETKESLEQQTGMSEILRVISSSPTDIQPVLQAVAESAARLCDASDAVIHLREGDDLRYVAHHGEIDTMPLGATKRITNNWIAGRAIQEGRQIHVDDALAQEHEYPDAIALARKHGYRTILVTPLLRKGVAVGTIAIRRTEVRPFSEKQAALVKTFADQAVIAIENVRLFNETKESLDQQTAISEVLRVISSTPSDVKPTLDAVAQRATRLCDAASASIYVLEGNVMRRTAFHGPETLEGTETLPFTPGTLTGRTIAEGKAIHVHDIERERENYPRSWEFAQKFGHHTMLAVPLMREGRAFGAMFLRRTEVRPFSDNQVALSRTFADQAAIAIENVRLFLEIQDKSKQLEIANKHKSEFLANMSHELRTPLNAIIGFSEVLIERMFGEVNEKQADYLKDIHESGKHLLSLINDILDLSKIEAGRMDLEISSFHLPTALSNAMTLVRERAQRHAIQLGLKVDPRLGEFEADERKFKQIVLNLLSNAVKFTADGGRVDVSAKLDTTQVEIEVKDTGIGIAPEDHAAVFEEFKQVGRDYTRKAEGTGLGLALTKRFVELHGGEIRLESAPGKGSTFTFTLPLRH